jgi:hypothetical protein
MRFTPFILLLCLLTGCIASHGQMPNARKYEDNAEALQVYLNAYGDGCKSGCRMATTDYSLPPDLVYTNSNPRLQAAGIDGFCDGKAVAMELCRQEMEEIEKHLKNKNAQNTSLEPAAK